MKSPRTGPRRPKGASASECARLLARVSKKGDARAARRLVDLYSDRLYALACRILSDRQAAEDVVQDVFLVLLQGKATYRGKGTADAFLLKVTSFLAIDRANAKVIRERRELGSMVKRTDAASSTRPVLDAVLRDELEAEIRVLLDELSPETRAAVTLRFWDGQTVREIARILSSTKSTVARRIDSALEKLRRPLLGKGLGASVAISLLGDLLESMEVASASPGFRTGLAKTIVTEGGRVSTTGLPTITESGALTVGKVTGVSVAALAVAAALVTFSLSTPEDPPLTAPRSVADGVAADGAPVRPEPQSSDNATSGSSRSPDRAGRETVAIAGRVVGPDGRPVARASVRLQQGEGRLPLEFAISRVLTRGYVSEAVTSSGGGFRFRGLSPGSYRVVAMAAGSAPGTSGLLRLRSGEQLAGVTLRLPVGEVVSGTARRESGEPASGVRVTAFLPVVIGRTRVGMWPYATTSGPGGDLRIPGVGSFAAELLVESDQFVVVEATKYARRGEELTVIVVGGTTISGSVEDPGGAPVAGAEVLAFTSIVGRGGAVADELSGVWTLSRSALSDGAGRFELRALGDVPHVLFVRMSGYALSAPLRVDVSAPDASVVRLRLRAAGRIEGRFVSGGRPFGPAIGVAIPTPENVVSRELPAVSFILSRFAMNPAAHLLGAAQFDVAEDGSFAVDGLAPREYLLTAYQGDDEMLPFFLWGDIVSGSGTAPRASFRPGQRDVVADVAVLPSTLLIAGDVVSAAGKPIPNASVMCSFRSSGHEGARMSQTVWADQHGVFRLETSPPSGYDRLDVTARTLDGRVRVLDGLALERDGRLEKLRMVIDSDVAIAGTVTSGAGEPLAGVEITLEQDGHEPWPRAEERRATSDRHGRFSFSAVEANRRYRLTAEADGWARSVRQTVEIGALDLHFELRPEGVIRGRVIDLVGRPVEITGMSLSRYVDGGVSQTSGPFAAEETGHFVLRGLPSGEYSLTARGAEGERGARPVTRESERIIVAEGETVEGIVLTMTDLVAIEGQTIDATSGAPIAGAIVADWDPESRNFPQGRCRVITDRHGRFRLTGFPRGSIRIYAVAEGYLKFEEDVSVSGEADTEGVTLKLTPARRLQLLVTDQDGVAIEGARVVSSYEWPKQGLTDRHGEASVIVSALESDQDSGSDGWVSVQMEGYSEARVELDDSAPREQLNIILMRSGTITGRVVDHTGAPLGGVRVMARRKGGRGTRVDDQGTYTISGLEPGDYDVELQSDDVPLPTLSTRTTVVAGRAARVDFVVPDPATFQFHAVRIVATFEDGRPAAAFPIRVSDGWSDTEHGQRSVSPLACFQHRDDLVTGPDGTLVVLFETADVSGLRLHGRHTVDGELYHLTTYRFPVVDGDVPVVFRRLPRGEVTLRARDAGSGEALSDYRYRIATEGHGSMGSRCRDVGGVVRRRVPAGDVTVRVEADGYAPYEQSFVLVDHGREVMEARLVRR